jgi:hypothetical protein
VEDEEEGGRHRPDRQQLTGEIRQVAAGDRRAVEGGRGREEDDQGSAGQHVPPPLPDRIEPEAEEDEEDGEDQDGDRDETERIQGRVVSIG